MALRTEMQLSVLGRNRRVRMRPVAHSIDPLQLMVTKLLTLYCPASGRKLMLAGKWEKLSFKCMIIIT
jgi:hypothetical protein